MYREPNSCDWQALDRSDQIPRYEAIASLLQRHSMVAKPRVLDVGCGCAELKTFLPWADYVGVEPSTLAAARAVERGAEVIAVSAEEWKSMESVNALIFNESLYYLNHPIATMERLMQQLRPGGVLIVSIFQRPGLNSQKLLLRWLMDGQRCYSNCHCSRLLDDWLEDGPMFVLSDKLVADKWRIWAARKPLAPIWGLEPMVTKHRSPALAPGRSSFPHLVGR